MSSYGASQHFVNVFYSTIRTKLSLMIISMVDVVLDVSPVVANMLFLFGGVTNTTFGVCFRIGEMGVGSSLNLFEGGSSGDDVTSAL
jgi:hypothetical protein